MNRLLTRRSFLAAAVSAVSAPAALAQQILRGEPQGRRVSAEAPLALPMRTAPTRGQPYVVVLHGLFRTKVSMTRVGEYLEKHGGYKIVNIGYPSTQQSIGEHARRLAGVVQAIPDASEINFVGYSLGNLVIRHYMGDTLDPATGRLVDPRVRRYVMLGPPNHAPSRAKLWADHPVFQNLYYNVLDDTGHKLAHGWPELEARLAIPPCEFGIIAGGRGDGEGWHHLLPGDDDGTITVAEARLPGAADFVVLPVNHTRMTRDTATFAYTLRFLQSGCFISPAARQPIVG